MSAGFMIIDSHAHLDFIDDLEGSLARAKEAGVGKIISVGTTIEESRRIIAFAEKHLDNKLKIFTTVGIHPKDGKEEVEKLGVDELIHRLREIAKSSKKVVAIGECGLDFYEISDKQKATSEEEKRLQRKLFEEQIKLAAELNLPLVVHCRNGWDDVFDLISSSVRSRHSRESENQILKQVQDDDSGLSGVFHSWTGDWNAAKAALDLGFYISFSGIVTFKNSPTVQDVAKKAPIDRILVETDSPFLAPEPLRGQKNEPERVKIVCKFIADIRKESFDSISLQTTENAERLFQI